MTSRRSAIDLDAFAPIATRRTSRDLALPIHSSSSRRIAPSDTFRRRRSEKPFGLFPRPSSGEERTRPKTVVADLVETLGEARRRICPRAHGSIGRKLAYGLHRLAFEGQVLLTDAWPGVFDNAATDRDRSRVAGGGRSHSVGRRYPLPRFAETFDSSRPSQALTRRAFPRAGARLFFAGVAELTAIENPARSSHRRWPVRDRGRASVEPYDELARRRPPPSCRTGRPIYPQGGCTALDFGGDSQRGDGVRAARLRGLNRVDRLPGGRHDDHGRGRDHPRRVARFACSTSPRTAADDRRAAGRPRDDRRGLCDKCQRAEAVRGRVVRATRSSAIGLRDFGRRKRHSRRGPGRQERRGIRLPEAPDRLDGDARGHRRH